MQLLNSKPSSNLIYKLQNMICLDITVQRRFPLTTVRCYVAFHFHGLIRSCTTVYSEDLVELIVNEQLELQQTKQIPHKAMEPTAFMLWQDMINLTSQYNLICFDLTSFTGFNYQTSAMKCVHSIWCVRDYVWQKLSDSESINMVTIKRQIWNSTYRVEPSQDSNIIIILNVFTVTTRCRINADIFVKVLWRFPGRL